MDSVVMGLPNAIICVNDTVRIPGLSETAGFIRFFCLQMGIAQAEVNAERRG